MSTVLASSLTYSASPIFFEFCVEIVYPVPEGIVGGFLTCLYNIFGGIFLAIFDIPGICKHSKFLKQCKMVLVYEISLFLSKFYAPLH